MDFKKIEKKWQDAWEKKKVFEADVDKKRKKFFITIPYPYVNGGPHIGHSFTWFRGDVYARFKRMQGSNVLYPQGFHATGEPILGTVERLRLGDKTQVETFKIYGATDKQIEEFKTKGAEYVARFWMEKWIESLKSAGFSIDWRRTFPTAITPTYNRFVEWQYNTLRKLGYVTQGTHPVVWCPHCQSPTGDHDRLKGEGESPIEYIILKFRLPTGEIVPTGTLRPETIYGVTNIWINPDVEYARVKVDNETWLLSERAVEKLSDQLRKVEIIDRVKGETFVGRQIENPATGNKVLILPASFVDPNGATGIVMSVPSHAPYDWIGLKDLQKDLNQLKKYNINVKEVQNIRPISIIKSEGVGEHPAIEVSDRMLITSQKEKEKLDKATSTVYKKEYHTGVLKENTAYAGCRVSEIKEKLISDFTAKNIADRMWELTDNVVCRCTTPNHVKILENQWFLKFSDPKWKALVRKAISKMKFYPEEARNQFLATVEWLKDKACTRKSGLGTKLPWDKEWIVETLSDSTIYMAYYTIVRILNEKKIPPEKLTDEVFNFIFREEGGLNDVAEKSKLSGNVLRAMKEEFNYFYPVDLRTSGKDNLQNHLVFYLFHHTALWPEKFWPKAIAINGWVTVSGEKMSKSKGNMEPFSDLVKRLGSDVARINIVSANENMDDADWREENVDAFKTRIENIYNLVKNLKNAKREDLQNVDKFLLSRMQSWISDLTENFEVMKFRSATQGGFFDATNDLKWYVERCGGIKNCNGRVLSKALETIMKINAPLIPHNAEELWSLLGNKSFISLEKWPAVDKRQIKKEAELSEELIQKTLQDVREVEKLLKKKASEIHIFIAPAWKFELYDVVRKNRGKDLKQVIGMIKNRNEEKVKYVQFLFKKVNELGDSVVPRGVQLRVLNEAKTFFEKQLNVKISISSAEDSNIEKAKSADVAKPAIYLI